MKPKKIRAIKLSDNKAPSYVTFCPRSLTCVGFGVYVNKEKEIFLQISEIEWAARVAYADF